jgi:UDP-glucose 4-epimerase
LINAGHNVTVLDNLSEGIVRQSMRGRNLSREIWGSANWSPKRLKNARRRRSFILQRSRSWANRCRIRASTYRNNVGWGVELVDAAVQNGVKKFVFSSTCATYGPPDRVPISEDLPQRPINPYGESKLMFEKVLQWYHKISVWNLSRSATSTLLARARSMAKIIALKHI